MKLRVILNQDCQLNCVYCYKEGIFSSKNSLLSLNDLKYALKTAFKIGFREIKFTGGEPMLSPLLIPLIDYAKKIGYKEIRITTNGILLGRYPHAYKKA